MVTPDLGSCRCGAPAVLVTASGVALCRTAASLVYRPDLAR